LSQSWPTNRYRSGTAAKLRATFAGVSGGPPKYESIFPDGKSTCVESDLENGMDKRGHQYVDIWRLALGGSGRVERLTHFNDYAGYKAPNSVVSDDGRYMAFHTARAGGAAGAGRDTFLYDRQGPESAVQAGAEAPPQARRGQAAWRCPLARAQLTCSLGSRTGS
jgi:hypothetical protein